MTSSMIRVEMPAHLRNLAQVNGQIQLEVEAPATQRTVLDALEANYPMLKGTLRDHVTKERRPFIRFFACEEDLSHQSPDTPLPEAVVAGSEPFWIIGAISGGTEPAAMFNHWPGRILTALPALFLFLDAGMKLMQAAPAVQATVELGYPASVVFPLGLILLTSTILYLIPRTAILGAILLTGYLGGAVATHLRVGNPLFSHILFPVYVGIMIWAGLCLRNRKLRNLITSEN